MGTVSIAVGCAVGIPIGVGLIIAFIFWFRLQRRFKEELKHDEELEHAIYDETGYISFDNFESLKQDHHLNGNDLSSDTIDQKNNSMPSKHGSTYVPAYRKKINSTYIRGTRISSINNVSETNSSSNIFNNNNTIPNNNNTMLNPNTSAMTSLSELSQQNFHAKQGKPSRLISVYDQMVPVVNNDSDEILVPRSNNSTNSLSQTDTSEIIHNSNSFLNNGAISDRESTLLNNFYQNNDLDLGSYYPRGPSNHIVPDAYSNINNDLQSNPTLPNSSNINLLNNRAISSASIHTRDSQTNSVNHYRIPKNNNVFATPSTERSGYDYQQSITPTKTPINLAYNKPFVSDEYNDARDTTNTGHDALSGAQHGKDNDEISAEMSVYKLQNNYDVQNNGEITEEDQYENEFTNYTENRRQFIASLRPN